MTITHAEDMPLALRAAEASFLFKGEMVREILAGQKTQTRRVVTPRNSEIGVEGAKWEHLDLAAAWRDPGFRDDSARKERGERGRSEYLKAPYHSPHDPDDELVFRVYPRIEIKQVACVRETWAAELLENERKPRDLPRDVAVWYQADDSSRRVADPAELNEALRRLRTTRGRWRPSIHMPKFMCRILLPIVAVRVERVQEITTDDIIAEGIHVPDVDYSVPDHPWALDMERDSFAREKWKALWESINGKRPGCSWADDPWVWVYEWWEAQVLK